MINIKIIEETEYTNEAFVVTAEKTFCTYEDYLNFRKQFDKYMKSIFKIPNSVYVPNIPEPPIIIKNTLNWHKFDPNDKSTWPEIGKDVIITPDDPYQLETVSETVMCRGLDGNIVCWKSLYNINIKKHLDYVRYWREM